jgi:hypothetical protein
VCICRRGVKHIFIVSSLGDSSSGIEPRIYIFKKYSQMIFMDSLETVIHATSATQLNWDSFKKHKEHGPRLIFFPEALQPINVPGHAFLPLSDKIP